MKAECTNERLPRAFDGECRLCSKTGHLARDCPEKPAQVCRNCKAEGEYPKILDYYNMIIFNERLQGHVAKDCNAPRAIDWTGVPDLSPDDAWNAVAAADDEKDLDDLRPVNCSCS